MRVTQSFICRIFLGDAKSGLVYRHTVNSVNTAASNTAVLLLLTDKKIHTTEVRAQIGSRTL